MNKLTAYFDDANDYHPDDPHRFGPNWGKYMNFPNGPYKEFSLNSRFAPIPGTNTSVKVIKTDSRGTQAEISVKYTHDIFGHGAVYTEIVNDNGDPISNSVAMQRKFTIANNAVDLTLTQIPTLCASDRESCARH